MIRRSTLKNKSISAPKIIIAGINSNEETHTLEEVNLLLSEVDLPTIDPRGMMAGFDP